MPETSLHFYHSKIKLGFLIIILFPFMIGFYYIVYMEILDQSYLSMLFFLFFAVLFSFVWCATILKLLRNQPYITITDSYLQLNPGTKSEMTIDYDQITSIQVSEASFQKIIEITIYNEGKIFNQLSLFNKIRLGPNGWFGFKTFTIGHNAIPKRNRPRLLAALDSILESKKDQTIENFTIADTHHLPRDSQKKFMKKYDSEPPVDLVIDKNYFKNAYLYSIFIFVFMLVLFYILLEGSHGYLIYIIVSFFTFPFAKLLIDWMGVYKLRQRLEKQRGVTYYFYQMKYLFDALLFHASIFIAPFGLLFLLMRIIKRKTK